MTATSTDERASTQLRLSDPTVRTFAQLLVNVLGVSVTNFTVWFAITFFRVERAQVADQGQAGSGTPPVSPPGSSGVASIGAGGSGSGASGSSSAGSSGTGSLGSMIGSGSGGVGVMPRVNQ
jgi:hypothetical protein